MNPQQFFPDDANQDTQTSDWLLFTPTADNESIQITLSQAATSSQTGSSTTTTFGRAKLTEIHDFIGQFLIGA